MAKAPIDTVPRLGLAVRRRKRKTARSEERRPLCFPGYVL